jgi:putative hemolysin
LINLLFKITIMVFLIIFVLLVLINAYFSAAEIAIVSVKKFRIQAEADKGNKNARLILDLIKNPDEYLSSIQVGITLIGIIEGLYGGEVLEAFLEPKLISWGMSHWSAQTVSFIIGVGLITYITIIIGELLPKSLALQFPQRIALRIVPSFRVFSLLAYPFVKLLTGSTHFLLRLLHVRGSENQKLTDADLKSLLSMAYQQGTLEKNEWLLHENIFKFYEGSIDKIMTPFEKVVVIDETMTSEMVENILRTSNHNYFPVTSQKDKIAGYLSAKDFFMQRGKTLKEITKLSCTVSTNQTAPELLQKFKEHKSNFSIVLNERGGIAGVVTIHDIAEILVGEIA